MDYADPVVRPLLDLEGLTRWLPGRRDRLRGRWRRPSTGSASTTPRARSPPMATDPEAAELGVYRGRPRATRARRGGHLLLDHAPGGLAPASACASSAADPHLPVHLGAWARRRGHRVDGQRRHPGRRRRPPAGGRRAGRRTRPGRRARHPPPGGWRPAARWSSRAPRPWSAPTSTGAHEVWTDLAPKLYAQAAAGQWDPATAIDWTPPRAARRGRDGSRPGHDLPGRERAGRARWSRPASSAGSTPTSGRCVQFLATQLADEARHVEVFTRRATTVRAPARGLGGRRPGVAADTARRAGLARRLLPPLGPRRRAPSSPSCRSSSATPPIRSPPASPTSPSRTRPATWPSPWATWASTSGRDPRCAGGWRRPCGGATTPWRRTAGLSDRGPRRPGRPRRRRVVPGGHRPGLGPGHLPSGGDGRGPPSPPGAARLLRRRSRRALRPAHPQLHVKPVGALPTGTRR